MKFKVQKELLLSKATKLAKIIPTSAIIPAYECLLIGIKDSVMTMYSSGNGIQIKTELPVASDLDGGFCVPARLFINTIREISANEIDIAVYTVEYPALSITLTITVGKSEYNIPCYPFEDFPRLKMKQAANSITLETNVFKSALNIATQFVDPNNAVVVIQGISLRLNEEKKFQITAALSYCIAKLNMAHKQVTNWAPVVISKSLVGIIDDLATKEEITIQHDTSKMYLDLEDYKVISVLIDQKFPNTNPHFENKKQSVEIPINNSEMSSIVKRLSLYTSEDHIIEIDIHKKSMVLRAEEKELNKIGKEEIAVRAPKEVRIGLNSKYLMKVFNTMNNEDAIFQYNGPKDPVFFSPATHTDLEVDYLVMAVALNK